MSSDFSVQSSSIEGQSLVQNSILIRVSFGRLGNSRKVGEEVLNTEADKSLFKVSKSLLDSEELDAIQKADAKLSAFIRKHAVPFDGFDCLLIPKWKFTEVVERLKEYADVERPALVQALVDVYPDRVAAAREALRTEFNDQDYPSLDGLRDCFKLRWRLQEFGIPGQLQQINPEFYLQEIEREKARIENATETIMQAQREILLSLLATLEEKLSGKADPETGRKKTLNAGAITKVQEFLETFKLANVTNDVALAELAQKAEFVLTGISTKDLKGKVEEKAQIAESLGSIRQSLASLVETGSGVLRRIKPVLEV